MFPGSPMAPESERELPKTILDVSLLGVGTP